MQQMLFSVVVIVSFFSSYAIYAYYDYEDGPLVENKQVLQAIDEIGEVAKLLMDPDMEEAYNLVLESIKVKVQSFPLETVQMSAANDLLDAITENLKSGKVQKEHLTYFLYFAQSSKLERLLSTWDKSLLKH